MMTVRGYAAFDPRSPLRPHTFERRSPGPRDVVIDIEFCGVCHSDLHQVRDEWQGSRYPMVPGHEIVGRVAQVGAEVSRFKAGDTAGVGCMVGSCGACGPCDRGLEQYCERGPVWTYNADAPDGTGRTQGGYSTRIVVDERFALHVSSALALDRAAPLLCAGITTWSPLKRWGVGKGSRVAVVGLGGLGHMGVRLAAALGAEVTLLSSSPKKREDARRLGAHDFVVASDDAAMGKLARRFDLVLDTVSAPHDLGRYLETVRLDGAMVLVGVPEVPPTVSPMTLIGARRSLAGSLIGGVRETQEMLDFCAAHGVVADVEVIAPPQIESAYERMLKSDVRYRFVVDTGKL